MSEKTTFFHPGYPKAGSSTLQTAIFNTHPQICNIYKSSADERTSLTQAIRNAWWQDDLYYDPVPLKRQVQEKVTNSSNKVPVFTHEGCFTFFQHGITMDRFMKALAPVKIIIMIRDQISWLESAYNHIGFRHPYFPAIPDTHYCTRPIEMNAWLSLHESISHGRYIHNLHYFSLADAIEKHYGVDSYSFFLLEEMANDIDAFSMRLSDFMGIGPEPIRTSLYENKYFRNESSGFNADKDMVLLQIRHPRLAALATLLPFGWSIMRLLVRKRAKPTRVPPEARIRLEEMYREGNRRFEEKYGLPLSTYGYAT